MRQRDGTKHESDSPGTKDLGSTPPRARSPNEREPQLDELLVVRRRLSCGGLRPGEHRVSFCVPPHVRKCLSSSRNPGPLVSSPRAHSTSPTSLGFHSDTYSHLPDIFLLPKWKHPSSNRPLTLGGLGHPHSAFSLPGEFLKEPCTSPRVPLTLRTPETGSHLT